MYKLFSRIFLVTFSIFLFSPIVASAADGTVTLGGSCTYASGDTAKRCIPGLVCDLSLESSSNTLGKCANNDVTGRGLDSGFSSAGLGKSDLKTSIASIINIVLGFLGIVAVIIVLAGGFKTMTAAGNEDKVSEGRQMIVQGVIGLVIIFAAWAIASFVLTQLGQAI
jgi:hypothetical protein